MSFMSMNSIKNKSFIHSVNTWTCFDGSVTTKIFRKSGKLPTFLNSQIPKRFKGNNIRGELQHAFKIDADFNTEV